MDIDHVGSCSDFLCKCCVFWRLFISILNLVITKRIRGPVTRLIYLLRLWLLRFNFLNVWKRELDLMPEFNSCRTSSSSRCFTPIPCIRASQTLRIDMSGPGPAVITGS